MRILLPLAAALSLSACATPAAQLSSTMSSDLYSLIGQPVDAAIARLGPPSGFVPMGDETVYGWGNHFTKEVAVVSTGVSDGSANLAPFSGKVSATTRVPVEQRCVVMVVAGADGMINGWHYEGNVGGCRRYGEQLARVS